MFTYGNQLLFWGIIGMFWMAISAADDGQAMTECNKHLSYDVCFTMLHR